MSRGSRNTWFGVAVMLCVGGCKGTPPAAPGQAPSGPVAAASDEKSAEPSAPVAAPVDAPAKKADAKGTAASNCGVDPAIERERIAAMEAKIAELERGKELHRQIEAQHKRDHQGIVALQEKMSACRKARRGLDPTCLAIARADSTLCTGVEDTELRTSCSELAVVAGAKREGEASRCGELSNRAARALCEGAVTGAYNCQALGRGALGSACRVLAQKSPPGQCDADGQDGARACNVVRLVAAMQHGNASICDAISDVPVQRECHAFLSRDEKHCLAEVDDPTCRNVVLNARLERPERSDGAAEVHLRAVNLFGGVAECKATIQIQGDGNVVAKKEVSLGPLRATDFVTGHVFPVKAPRTATGVSVQTACAWDSQ